MDYAKGRFLVLDTNGQLIGRIDEDEFVRSLSNQLLYRVDGEEFYDMSGALIGYINDGRVIVAGQERFRIETE